MKQPVVSVLITAFNREEYIAEAIHSVLASSFTNFEIIIVDDASTDETAAIAKKYEAKDSRIKLFINSENVGDYRNRNKAASFASGKYIKYLDSDDVLLPWALDIMVRCMEEQPQAALGLSPNIAVNEKLPIVVQPEQAYFLYYFKNFLLNVGPTAAIIRLDVFRDIGGFSGYQYIGDTELWLRIAKKYPILCLPANLIWWREHDMQQIVLEKKELSAEKNRYELNVRLLNEKNCPFGKEIANLVLKNIRAAQCRWVLWNVTKLRLTDARQRIKRYNLKPEDFIRALRKNKVPAIIHPFKGLA
jgi:glycosyltransferase involved in cell wall biosynthesis